MLSGVIETIYAGNENNGPPIEKKTISSTVYTWQQLILQIL